jgi:hypothetical protein
MLFYDAGYTIIIALTIQQDKNHPALNILTQRKKQQAPDKT